MDESKYFSLPHVASGSLGIGQAISFEEYANRKIEELEKEIRELRTLKSRVEILEIKFSLLPRTYISPSGRVYCAGCGWDGPPGVFSCGNYPVCEHCGKQEWKTDYTLGIRTW